MRPKPILIVDDNQDDVFLLRHAMQVAGFVNPVQTVESGTDAIHYLEGEGKYQDRSSYPYPAFLLLDLHLPLQSGFDVLRWLRDNPQPSLEVVVCTGTASPEEVRLARSLGAQEVLDKTADFSEFVKQLSSIPRIHVHAEDQRRELIFD